MSDQTDRHFANLTARTEADEVLDQLVADNDQLIAALADILDVEAGLQQILDNGQET